MRIEIMRTDRRPGLRPVSQRGVGRLQQHASEPRSVLELLIYMVILLLALVVLWLLLLMIVISTISSISSISSIMRCLSVVVCDGKHANA